MAVTTLLTAAQFLALPDEYDAAGNRIKQELIAGEVVAMPPPSQRHDLIKNRIGRILGRHLDSHQADLEVLVETAYSITEHEILVPDVSLIRKDRLSPKTVGVISGAPALAVEVISPSETAMHVKHKVDAYLSAGAHSVWVVYPDEAAVVLHSPNSIREVRAGQILEEPMLPGVSIPVSEILHTV